MEAVLVSYQQKGQSCSSATADGNGSHVVLLCMSILPKFWWEFWIFFTEKRNNQAVSESWLSVSPRAASIAYVGETGNKGSWLHIVAITINHFLTCTWSLFLNCSSLCSTASNFNRTMKFPKPDWTELGCKKLFTPKQVHKTECSLLKIITKLFSCELLPCRTSFHIQPMFCLSDTKCKMCNKLHSAEN